MNPLIAGAVALTTEPSPNPTENQLRPGLEEWQVSPGLIGFLVTFALAVACVLLFLNMTKHLRRAGHNAREQGLPVATPDVIGFRREDGDGPGSDGRGSDGPGSGGSGSGGTPDHSPSPSEGGGSSSGSGSSDSGSSGSSSSGSGASGGGSSGGGFFSGFSGFGGDSSSGGSDGGSSGG